MDKQIQAAAILKALAYTENGGKPDLSNLKAGKSGEAKSIFQFTPSTWKLYAKQELGDPNAPMTSENEALVVHGKISKWLDHGFNTEQIASMWNAGENKPDAYKQNWKGKNKYGVAYDTPAYAKKVADYAKKFEGEAKQFASGVIPEAKKSGSGLMGKIKEMGSSLMPQTANAETTLPKITPDPNSGLMKSLMPPQ